jgi:SAM-dependent methyltransferase
MEPRPLDLGARPLIRDIAPGDAMHAHDPEHYFESGAAALRCIALALRALKKPIRIRSILDLPCGHGRVLRFLRHEFPEAEITACDIERDGVEFCAGTFGSIPAHSHEDPARIELGGGFDLIWCGSLLTHLDAGRWRGFLDLFESRLSPGGVLVFTTHGRRFGHLIRAGQWVQGGLGPERTRLLLEEYERTGFGYQDRPRRAGSGISLSALSWVCAEVERRPGWRLISATEMGWGNQDVFACVRKPVDRLPAPSS